MLWLLYRGTNRVYVSERAALEVQLFGWWPEAVVVPCA
jgi:hypothetical protein